MQEVNESEEQISCKGAHLAQSVVCMGLRSTTSFDAGPRQAKSYAENWVKSELIGS